MKSLLFAALILVSGGASSILAQQAKPATDKRLNALVGDWDVNVRYKMPDGKEYEGRARCQTKWIMDGKFIQQNYDSKMNGQDLKICQILGEDSFKKKLVEFQLHVMAPMAHTLHNEGAFSADGKTLTLSGETVDGETGKPAKLRTVTTLNDADHYTLEWFVTDASGKEERKVVLDHTRKK